MRAGPFPIFTGAVFLAFFLLARYIESGRMTMGIMDALAAICAPYLGLGFGSPDANRR